MCETTAAAVDKPVAGVGRALGDNSAMAPSWLIYITVADLDESVRRYAERLYQPE